MSDDDDLPISGAEITAAARAVAALRRALRRPDPATVLRRRAQVRDEIERNLRRPEKDNVPEIIVIKHTKYDEYPKPDERLVGRGASSWFKAEVKEIHDRGLEVYVSIEHVVVRKGKAYRVPNGETRGARKVWVVGRIPYEWIVYFDWQPDRYYGLPRFYVAYSWRGDAVREVVLYEGSPRDYQYEMVDVKYKGEGGGPLKRLRRRISTARFMVESRRRQRKWRDERYGPR